jgi:hypothetical protein
MKKLAISLILMGAAPAVLASTASNNPVNSNSYNNSLTSNQAEALTGPQHIHNPSLFPNQQSAQNQQNNAEINSGMFGMNGPLSLSSDYSTQYGFIVSGQYTQAFGQNNAASLELDAGAKERRINGTWATAISNHQRLKLSAEYLQQKMDFGFLSGEVNKWVGQQAYGLSYQYLLNNKFIQSINANSTYSTVKSQSLANKIMPNDSDWINVRRIAGGTDKSFSGGASFTPFSTTKLDLALDYDELTYDIKYHNQYQQAKNARGLGVTANLSQLITKHVKVQLGGSDRKIYDSYQAEIDYLAHTHPGSQLSFGLSTARTIGSAGLPNDTRLGLHIDYAWGGNTDANTAAYTASNPVNSKANVRDDLAQWAADPAVHRSQVLAVADQKLISNNNNNAANNALLASNTVVFPLKNKTEVKTGNVTGVITASPSLTLDAKTSPIDLGEAMKGGLFQDNLPTNGIIPDMTNSYYQSTDTKTTTTGSLDKLGLKLTTMANGNLALSGTPTQLGTFKIFVFAKDSASTPHSSFVDKNDGAQIFTVTISKNKPSFTKSVITANDTATEYQSYSTDMTSFINDPITSDSSLQLIPTDKNGTVDASAWTTSGYKLTSNSATQGNAAAKISGTISQSTPVTLYAIAKNKYGQSGVATITINVKAATKPNNISENMNVGDTWKNIDITSNVKQYFPAGDKVTFKTTSAFTRKAGGTGSPKFDISVTSDGQLTSSSGTLPASDEGQWVATITATDGKITTPAITITMNITSPAAFNKTPADQHVAVGQTTFTALDLSQDLDPGYEPGETSASYNTTDLDGTGLTLDSKTGVISLASGSKISSAVGTKKITVNYTSVVAGASKTTSTSFSLITKPKGPAAIHANSVNGKSTWNVTNGKNTFFDKSTSVDFSKGFENVDGATYSISGLPDSNLSIDSKTGVFTLPTNGTNAQPGNYAITVTATDDGGSATIKVNLNVVNSANNNGWTTQLTLQNSSNTDFSINNSHNDHVTQAGFPDWPPVSLSAGSGHTGTLTASNGDSINTQHEMDITMTAHDKNGGGNFTIPVHIYAPTAQEECTAHAYNSCGLSFRPLAGNFAEQVTSGSTQGYNFTLTQNSPNSPATLTVTDAT